MSLVGQTQICPGRPAARLASEARLLPRLCALPGAVAGMTGMLYVGGGRASASLRITGEDNMTTARLAAVTGGALMVALLASPSGADIVSDWSTAVAPPPPELKEVTVDPATTALLFLDIMKGNCSARPRCVAA